MFDGWGWRQLAWGAGLFVVSLAVTSVIMVVLLLRIRQDHLLEAPASRRPLNWREWARKIAKNTLGAVLVLVGMVLSLPGVPGQGLLTIFAGMLLLDFPGKHHLECRLMRRDRLFHAINAVRARFGKPALLRPPDFGPSPR